MEIPELDGPDIAIINAVERYIHDMDTRRRIINFLLTPNLKDKLLGIKLYHSSPSYLRENIEKEGLHNKNPIFTEEQVIFYKRMNPQELYNSGHYVFGNDGRHENGLRRGVYLSDRRLFYVVPESIRFYFRDLIGALPQMNDDEKNILIRYFRDFHERLLYGIDTWEIAARSDAEFFQKIVEIYIREFGDNLLTVGESLFSGWNCGLGVNIEIDIPIPNRCLCVIHTEKFSHREMWGNEYLPLWQLAYPGYGSSD